MNSPVDALPTVSGFPCIPGKSLGTCLSILQNQAPPGAGWPGPKAPIPPTLVIAALRPGNHASDNFRVRGARRIGPVGLFLTAAMVAGSVIAVPSAAHRRVTVDVALSATDALIMTGTDMHAVDPGWIHVAVDHFVAPSLGGRYTAIPVVTPEEFWPFGGLLDRTFDQSVAVGTAILHAVIADTADRHTAEGNPDAPIAVFGYSQSAVIITEEKRRLAAAIAAGEATPPLSLVMLGNPARPNGGLLGRFPGLRLPGWTFSGTTPTNTPFPTVDIARQYDPFADFPRYPLNPFALANSVLGLFYAHDYSHVTLDPADSDYNPGTTVQQYGDTTYYLIPAEHLPLLQPVRDLGIAPRLLDSIEPTLRTLVEAGYDRDLSAGSPAPAQLFPEIPRRERTTEPAIAPVGTRSIGEDRDRLGPSRRRGVHLDRKAGHLEAVVRK